MPETEFEIVTKEWLQSELRSASKDLIILDCRSSNEYIENHIRSAVNFSIPSIMLRRLAAGKIDLLSTIKSRELKERIQTGYKISLFVLYNENSNFIINNIASDSSSSLLAQQQSADSELCESGHNGAEATSEGNENISGNDNYNRENIDGNNYNYCNDNEMDFMDETNKYCADQQQQQQPQQFFGGTTNFNFSSGFHSVNCSTSSGGDLANTSTINVLHRRLKQDGCRVVCLQGGFSSFRDAFPEWCEEDSQNQEMESSHSTTQADQLMGLRSLRISTPHSDSACSSSAESSDCESTSHYYHHHHHHLKEAPVEIVPGLFLGNASHSGDSSALQKYNIKYVLNVTPDLPNHFEASGCGIQYLQIPITDHYSQDLAVHFPAAIRFIEEAQSKGSAVLVHCLAGVSRSVTVTLAYLMHTKSLCLNDAFSLVRDRKPDVAPNFHFMEQLHSFERQLKISPSHDHHHHSHNHHLHHSDSLDPGSSGTISSSSSNRICDKCPPSASSSTSNYSTCIDNSSDCKCMHTDFLARAKITGVSPDSGIEFDRWTPSLGECSSASGSGTGIGGNGGDGGGGSNNLSRLK